MAAPIEAMIKLVLEVHLSLSSAIFTSPYLQMVLSGPNFLYYY
jgi:hypothetical protein